VAVSHKPAMMPQAVLQDDKSSRHDAAIKVGSDAARKTLYGLILLS
jgi:hypothetical protein